MEHASESLRGLRFSLVGPGRVGSSLASWACQSGARAVQVGGRDPAVAGLLATALGATATDVAGLETAGEELLLIAVADPALDEVASVLAKRPQAAVALHTSGSRGATALAPLAAAGVATGSVHPLRAFPETQPDVSAAVGTVFATDGAPAARALAARLVSAWGGRTVHIPEEHRLLYHLAATLAAGGVVTLAAAAQEILLRQGLPAETMQGYLHLAQDALREVEKLGSAAPAITGPVARGDRELVSRQLEQLQKEVPDLVPLVTEIARQTLRQLSLQGSLDENRRKLLADLDKFHDISSFLDP